MPDTTQVKGTSIVDSVLLDGLVQQQHLTILFKLIAQLKEECMDQPQVLLLAHPVQLDIIVLAHHTLPQILCRPVLQVHGVLQDQKVAMSVQLVTSAHQQLHLK